jgi:hypothetical protein
MPDKLTPADFRALALSLEGAEQGSHMGAEDFRVGGRVFATLASAAQGYGNLMFDPPTQSDFIEELHNVFIPIAGGWGRMGVTHVILANATREQVLGALQTAWRLRVQKNTKAKSKAEKR